MILKFSNTDFSLDNAVYYSTAFKIETKDTFMTVESTLSGSGTVIIQASTEGIVWYDVVNSSFSCTPSGIQSFVECQPELLYRLKSVTAFINAKIVI